MKIIILGGGTVGVAICSQLVGEGHDLTTILELNFENSLNQLNNR